MNVSRRSMPVYGYDSNAYTDGDGSDSNEDLRWVLYLTLIFGAIEIIIIYGKYDFLNVFIVINLAYCPDLSVVDLLAQPF